MGWAKDEAKSDDMEGGLAKLMPKIEQGVIGAMKSWDDGTVPEEGTTTMPGLIRTESAEVRMERQAEVAEKKASAAYDKGHGEKEPVGRHWQNVHEEKKEEKRHAREKKHASALRDKGRNRQRDLRHPIHDES